MLLLAKVLAACSAQDLLRIENETRSGGRVIDPGELAAYWKKVYLEDFGSCAGSPDDWKGTYLAKQKELEDKRARVGKKVRGMWDEEKRKKDMRRIQVIDKVPESQLKRGREASKVAAPPDSVRQRLAKKLRINPVTIKSPPFAHRSATPKGVVGGLREHDIAWDALPVKKRETPSVLHD